ncbi:phytanoyl-CoA hydroxylase [Microdochium nivale]|nr:phytanoyl-CoA hydroxylase [Microdochium nivale]
MAATTPAPPTMEELLSHQKFKTLTPEQVTHFMKHGFVRIPDAIPLDKVEWWTRDVWTRLGIDPNDKSTWGDQDRVHMAKHAYIATSEIAPKAWEAMCELLGGEDRIAENGKQWVDSFIVNLGSEAGAGKVIEPKELDNWHVDGDYFVHALDSPEQALLVIPCWSDVVASGGATVICTEGPKRIGQLLFDNPQGLNPAMQDRDIPAVKSSYLGEKSAFKIAARASADDSFFEMTGNKGDVILMHPLMLHSAANNAKRAIRIITNPPVSLSAPFQFDREDPTQYSLVELKTIQDLGGPDKLKGWKMTQPRALIVPERQKMQNEQLKKENERLRAIGRTTNDDPMSQLPRMMLGQQLQQPQSAVAS